jgi:HD-GYP domain-containing protein (c-di-GMP phosphodiesterase class II)
VRATHEHWNGGGYPDGLARHEIPLAARIIAVCDAYTAMTSERPYQTTASAEQALAELRRRAGSQFDADVVTAFCEQMSEGQETRRTSPAELEAREWEAQTRYAPASPAAAD